jgi:FtsH-binding integral membrane protein
MAEAKLPDSNLESKSKQFGILFTVIFFIFYCLKNFFGYSENGDKGSCFSILTSNLIGSFIISLVSRSSSNGYLQYTRFY